MILEIHHHTMQFRAAATVLFAIAALLAAPAFGAPAEVVAEVAARDTE